MKKISGLLILLAFLFIFPFCASAAELSLDVSYGCENQAKSGLSLPVRISLSNSSEDTFSGYISLFISSGADSVCQYRYRTTLEGHSESELNVNVTVSGSARELYAEAETLDGTVSGSRRIGLDLPENESRVLIGILSDDNGRLQYLNNVPMDDGLLMTRTVPLNSADFPDNDALSQLDVLLITNFQLSKLEKNVADNITRFVENGGTLILGTGALGMQAVDPYFSDLLETDLDPMEMSIDMGEEYGNGEPGSSNLNLMASAVYLKGGRDALFSDVIPIISTVPRGNGNIAVCGYDFSDLERFATEQSSSVDKIFTAILGQSRIEELASPPAEASLSSYYGISELLSFSDMSRLPGTHVYAMALLAYVLLAGPGIAFYLRERNSVRMYRRMVLMIAVLGTILIFVMGFSTRLDGEYLTFAGQKDISQNSVTVTDYLDLRSPDRRDIAFPVNTEFFVNPVLKPSSESGDVTELAADSSARRTLLDAGRDHNEVFVKNGGSFEANYFRLQNKIPNTGGAFTGELKLFDGTLTGTVTNGTNYNLSNALLIFSDSYVRIGTLNAGESVDVSKLELKTRPVGNDWVTPAEVSGVGISGVLTYYLDHSLNEYFSDARLVGFERDPEIDFSSRSGIEHYGVSMITASLPVDRTENGLLCQSALFRDPVVVSGAYDFTGNTIPGGRSAVLSYDLGEDADLVSVTFQSLSAPEDNSETVPFRGSVSLLNQQSGGYDEVDLNKSRVLSAEDLKMYLTETNTLTVRYYPVDNASPVVKCYLPVLRVISRERMITAEEPTEDQDTEEESTEDLGSEVDSYEDHESEEEPEVVNRPGQGFTEDQGSVKDSAENHGPEDGSVEDHGPEEEA